MEPKSPVTAAEAAATIVAQTDALLLELSDKLSELRLSVHGGPNDISGFKSARPKIMSALYCLFVAALRGNDQAQFNQLNANVRAELKRLHPDWKGPFSFESTLRQGEGMYLRDAPNITELVRSKPDYVFEEEWHEVQKSGDWMALFALKAKIQILESVRILTHNPSHVPLTAAIQAFIRSTADSWRTRVAQS